MRVFLGIGTVIVSFGFYSYVQADTALAFSDPEITMLLAAAGEATPPVAVEAEPAFRVDDTQAATSDLITEEEQQQNFATASRLCKQIDEQQQEVDKIIQSNDQQQRTLSDELDTFYKDVGGRQGRLEMLTNKLAKYAEARVAELTKKLATAAEADHSYIDTLLKRCNTLSESLAAFRKDLSQVIMNRTQVDKIHDAIRQHSTDLHNQEYEYAKILSEAHKAKNNIMAAFDVAEGKKNVAQVTELHTKATQLKTEISADIASQYTAVRTQTADIQNMVAQLEQRMRQMEMEVDSIAGLIVDHETKEEKSIVKTIQEAIKPAKKNEAHEGIDTLNEATRGFMTIVQKFFAWVKDFFGGLLGKLMALFLPKAP